MIKIVADEKHSVIDLSGGLLYTLQHYYYSQILCLVFTCTEVFLLLPVVIHTFLRAYDDENHAI